MLGNVRLRTVGEARLTLVNGARWFTLRHLPVFTDELSADTRTAVTFLFTSNADLFFPVGVVVAGRLVDNVGRRVLTFPSGPFLVLGELCTKLLVGLGGSHLRGLVVLLVGRRENAEGNGNSGFKIQVDDL